MSPAAASPTTLTLGRDARSGEPVQLVIPAPAAGRPPGVLLVGQSGTGKTFALRHIGQEAARAGSRVINVAPLDLSFVREDEIDLTNPDALPGVLDPLRTASPALREQITAAALLTLLEPARAWEAPITAAVRDASAKRGGGDLGDVIDVLRASTAPAARDAADALAVFADYGLARLLFPARVQRSNASAREWRRSGAADRHAADPAAVAAVRDHVLDQPITTIRVPLVDPPANYLTPAADHTTDERVAAATAILLAAYAMRLAASTTMHTVVLFDSLASAVIDSTRGRAVFAALARAARARNTTIVLTTLYPAAAASLAPMFATRLAFGSGHNEAKRTAELLGLADEELWAERLTHYRTGQCVLRDFTGQVTELVVAAPPTLVS